MSQVAEVRAAIRAEREGKPDIAHRQLVAEVVDTAHPAYSSILALTGKRPMRQVFLRIPPFWERD